MKLIQRSNSGPVRALATLTVASLALVAAACGSSTPHPSSPTAAHDPANAAYQFSACMRNHGVNNFPDPKVSSSQSGSTTISIDVPATLVKSSPQFSAARQACRGLLPSPRDSGSPAQLHAREQEMLAFARCVRSHGFTNFPDPTSQGQLTVGMIHAAGVDLHAPDALPTARACIGVTHGLITPNDVARAINGQG
jgi:hypothetical protein